MMIADHITPLGIGGSNETKNGQLLCFFCNLKFGWQARYKQAQEERKQTIRLIIEQGTTT